MKEKTIINRIAWVFAALILAVLVCLQSVPMPAFAEEVESKYTNVLDDLEKDDSFNASDYPAKANDYSLQVIQIAESVNGELFVYVYQPSNSTKELTATTIRFATPVAGIDSEWRDYDLELLSTEGVFDKYIVEDFKVKSDSVRYYDITAIHRKFDETIDDKADENYEQAINEVVYEVAQQWTAISVNGVVSYSMLATEVIKIKDKIVGYLRYPDGYSLAPTSCDSHFVAFSTDRKIEKLYEADVSYVWTSYEQTTAAGTGTNKGVTGGPETAKVSLNVEDTGENDGDGLFGKKYTWNRIESVSNFIANESEDLNLSNADLSDLQGKQWILRFVDTEYVNSPFANNYKSWTEISEVTILRLKFETDGVVYNLGVIDNKQTGSKDPFAEADTELDDAMEKFDFIIAIIALLLFLAVLVRLLTPIIGLVIDVVSIPFSFIGSLFKGGKK